MNDTFIPRIALPTLLAVIPLYIIFLSIVSNNDSISYGFLHKHRSKFVIMLFIVLTISLTLSILFGSTIFLEYLREISISLYSIIVFYLIYSLFYRFIEIFRRIYIKSSKYNNSESVDSLAQEIEHLKELEVGVRK